MKSMYFMEYVCRFSRKLHYFCILGVSHLNSFFTQTMTCTLKTLFPNTSSYYNDVVMSTMASQITNLTIVYSAVYSGADQRKHQSFASLAFVRRIHLRPVNSPHKWPVTRKMFPFYDVIMTTKKEHTNWKWIDMCSRGSCWANVNIM